MVVLWPTIPFRAAGMRMLPPVSLPMAKPASPAPMATPEPDDEPPGHRWVDRSQGLRGVPRALFWPVAEKANSAVLVFPRITQPAWRRLWMKGPSLCNHNKQSVKGDAYTYTSHATADCWRATYAREVLRGVV
jgi:hypothetical protein